MPLTRSMAKAQPRTTPRFLRLPCELRDEIYGFAVVPDNIMTVPQNTTITEPGLLTVCKQFREEAAPIVRTRLVELLSLRSSPTGDRMLSIAPASLPPHSHFGEHQIRVAYRRSFMNSFTHCQAPQHLFSLTSLQSKHPSETTTC